MKGFMGGMGQLMKQANQMQMKMKKVQEELTLRTYTGTAGGGAVTVEIGGDYLVKSVKINPDTVKDGDLEIAQDLIAVAINEAVKTAKETSAKEMEKVTGGMNIPGLF